MGTGAAGGIWQKKGPVGCEVSVYPNRVGREGFLKEVAFEQDLDGVRGEHGGHETPEGSSS